MKTVYASMKLHSVQLIAPEAHAFAFATKDEPTDSPGLSPSVIPTSGGWAFC